MVGGRYQRNQFRQHFVPLPTVDPIEFGHVALVGLTQSEGGGVLCLKSVEKFAYLSSVLSPVLSLLRPKFCQNVCDTP